MGIIKECANENCGRSFVAVKKDQKCCCKECRMEYRSIKLRREYLKRSKKEQLCWRCKNATGSCPWSFNGTPVEGWKAIPITFTDEDSTVNTYHITDCPMLDEEQDYIPRMVRDMMKYF